MLNRFWISARNGFAGPHARSRRPGAGVAAAILETLEDRQLLSAVLGQAPETKLPSASLQSDTDEHSVARRWNEALLDAIRQDTPRPTVHARNLFHTSAAMYDAWAAYDPSAEQYLHHESATASDVETARNEAISFAAYRVLSARFANSPGAAQSLAAFDRLMDEPGYDRSFTSTAGPSPAALGNRIAATVLAYGLADGSNEANNYRDTSGYAPANPPLDVTAAGATLDDPNLWQPLIVGGNTQVFLTPHWGDVEQFAMSRPDSDAVYHDPGPPPLLGWIGDAEFREAVLRVIRYSSHLDPEGGITMDASPAARGNHPLGTDDGTGHAINPYTGLPYESNVVNQADWGRVLAEFWADGPNSETPPGHWNTIANTVSDHPHLEKRIGGTGELVDDLEWDVKLYLALNGAVHDAAIAAWDAKEAYDYVRPISMIRYMGGLGQSSDPGGPSYHVNGLPLDPGLVELVTSQSIADGRHAHLAGHEGEVAIFAWAGHPDDPSQVGGVDWVLAEDWMPYQAENFVTPPFAGYVSGHSTFSRASAEVLTRFTGSAFFPGGLGTFVAAADSLKFEGGPTEDVELQWATYYDAADEAGLSRIYGGIHVDADDFAGRIIGAHVGRGAFERAADLFGFSTHLEIVLPGGNGADSLTIRRNGVDLEIVNDTTGDFQRRSLALTDSITIVGADRENDTLIVDFAAGGAFLLSGGIRFEGGRRVGDALIVRGTDERDEVHIHGTTVVINGLSITTAGVESLKVDALGGDDELQTDNAKFRDQVEFNGGRGDDLYRLSARNTEFVLRDASGVETLDFSDASKGLLINLGLDRGQLQRIGAGGNTLRLHGIFENVIGTRLSDTIFGNDADNVLRGGAGNDRLFGREGNDELFGEEGRDLLLGGRGDDVLWGGPGLDLLLGGPGDDEIRDGLFAGLGRDWSLFDAVTSGKRRRSAR